MFVIALNSVGQGLHASHELLLKLRHPTLAFSRSPSCKIFVRGPFVGTWLHFKDDGVRFGHKERVKDTRLDINPKITQSRSELPRLLKLTFV